MAFGFPSTEEYTMSQFVMLFLTLATVGTSALRILEDFMFLTSDVSKVLLESDGNIWEAAIRCFVV